MKTIITIGRQYGSAGHSIGKILADDLGIKYYDKAVSYTHLTLPTIA